MPLREEQEIDEALLVFGLANLDQETGLSTLYLGSENKKTAEKAAFSLYALVFIVGEKCAP